MQKSTKTRSDFAPREKHRQHCGLVAKKPQIIRAILLAVTCQRIVLHDTRIFGERSEDGGPGLLEALRAFLRQFLKWSVVYHTQANHGLTVISRNSRDKPALPGRITMAANLTRAVAAHVADGQQSRNHGSAATA